MEARPLGYEAAFEAWMRERGMRCERVRYARPAAGGETLAWRLRPARAPRGVVVVAHGAGNDALYAMVGLFKRLLRRGIEIFSFDMDGHGRHSTTSLEADAAADACADAAARALDGRAGLPLHALGVSLGGAFLLRTLADWPGRFASATIVVAPLHIEFSLRSVAGELGGAALRTLWRERHDYGLWGLVPSFGPVKRSV
jgi:alpha-beta hydrolase superfamily lysophospholipase